MYFVKMDTKEFFMLLLYMILGMSFITGIIMFFIKKSRKSSHVPEYGELADDIRQPNNWRGNYQHRLNIIKQLNKAKDSPYKLFWNTPLI